METFNPTESYLRLATACPEVYLADVEANVEAITGLYSLAVQEGVALVTFPELSITGYTLGDLVQQTALLRQAEQGLFALAEQTAGQKTAMVVGLPLRVGNALYNCAAVLSEGEVKGIVPKQNLPTYGEFYEKRWFQAWDQPTTTVGGPNGDIPVGTDLLFDLAGTKAGVEICEDLWILNSPHIELTNQGAQVTVNPSASPERVNRPAKRRSLVEMASERTMGAYVYAGCDWTESTMDVVMSGHQMIVEDGSVVAERAPFATDTRLLTADIDLEHINHDRLRDTNFVNVLGGTVIKTLVERAYFEPEPRTNPHPFLPAGETAEQRDERLQSIIDIQAHGLARRLMAVGHPKLHLGLSGGLDSTLAFLVGIRAAEILGKAPREVLHTYTMPGEASSERTQSNAVKLAGLYGITNEVLPIDKLTAGMLETIGHNGEEQDVTYENAQARLRTSILLNKANQQGGIVLGTGDLSEIALGWCTFNGDHISQYHVNAGVPKTLVQHLVRHIANHHAADGAKEVLLDILDTPISPELVKAEEGEISQKTEDIIGPYELHDYFLYQLIRWGDPKAKIAYVAKQAFAVTYTPEEIDKWLDVFITRFTRSQFKRSVMPDGPKVGSIALSPRGDWRMPSDLMNEAVWG